MTLLKDFLKKHRREFVPVIDFGKKTIPLDFSEANRELLTINLEDTEAFSKYLLDYLNRHRADTGYGGYAEDRVIYKRSKHFGKDEEARSIHLGIDIWGAAGTKIKAPADAIVHSFQINDNFGDYGPTIILEHHLKSRRFYTLYGHLSENSLMDITEGQAIAKGTVFAFIGAPHENGHWPPHLHFQIIDDMKDYRGDFPGVCRKSEKEHYLQQCPDPKIILPI